MPSKKNIPLFDLYKELEGALLFEIFRLEESYTAYDASNAHRHNYYEIIYFEKTGGSHDIDFKNYPIEQNTFHFISPEQVHRLMRKKQVTGFVLSFKAEFFLNDISNAGFIGTLPYFNDSDAPPYIRLKSGKNQDDCRQEILRMMVEFQSTNIDKKELLISRLQLFLLLLKRYHRDQHPSGQNHSLRSPITSRYKKLVDLHFSESKSVSDYARRLNITAGHLNDTIQKDTGKSASDILYARILLEAKRLLFHSSLSIKEIASVLNYEDASHFSRFFKNHTGQAPELFRTSIRELSC